MYKCKLQELCHQRRWALPSYSSVKDGPDHCSSFRSSVHVAGRCFVAPVACSSLKEAQNEAAKLAFLQISTTPSPEESNRSNDPTASGLNLAEEARRGPLSSEFVPASKFLQNLDDGHGLVPAPRIVYENVKVSYNGKPGLVLRSDGVNLSRKSNMSQTCSFHSVQSSEQPRPSLATRNSARRVGKYGQIDETVNGGSLKD